MVDILVHVQLLCLEIENILLPVQEMYVNIDTANIMFLGLFVIRRKKIPTLNGVVSVH